MRKNVIALTCVGATALAVGSANAALVGHYKFEETSGTTLADSSGNGYDGNVVGSGDLNVAGIVGSAYEPGGSNSYGRVTDGVSDFGISGNAARTISLWFNSPNFGGSSDQYRLIGMGSGAAGSFDIVAEAGTNAGGTARIGVRYGNGNTYYDVDNAGNPLPTNTWTHVAVAYDGTTLDLEGVGATSDGVGLSVYINGVLIDRDGGNGNNGTQSLNTTLTEFAIGSAINGGSHSIYPGLLDDIQVYDEALSGSQIASLFNNPGTVIPEPSSLALLGAGGLFMLKRRKRA